MRAILTYHSIDGSGSVISVSPAAFRRHMIYFRSAGIPVLSVDDLLAGPDTADAVALTFDDGYANLADEVMPVLEEHRLPATVFVATACVGGTNTWAAGDAYAVRELPLLDWDALGKLRERGLSVGSHTRTHPHFTRLSEAQIDDEIEGAARELAAKLGVPPAGLAYPYGEATAAARRAAARTHAWACTTMFDVLPGSSPVDLPRIDMWYFERPGVLESWGSPAFRRWVTRRRRLRHVRSLVRGVIGR